MLVLQSTVSAKFWNQVTSGLEEQREHGKNRCGYTPWAWFCQREFYLPTVSKHLLTGGCLIVWGFRSIIVGFLSYNTYCALRWLLLCLCINNIKLKLNWTEATLATTFPVWNAKEPYKIRNPQMMMLKKNYRKLLLYYSDVMIISHSTRIKAFQFDLSYLY